MEGIDHYGELLGRGDVPNVALCLTFVALPDVDEALVRYDGFRPARRDSVSELGQWAPPAGLSIVVADRHGDGVLLVENNGFHSTLAGVLERLSAGTVAASVYWNINLVSRLRYAVDGRLLTSFDFVVNGPDDGADPTAAAPHLDGLRFDSGHAREAALVFLERVAGARLTAQWLTADHPACVIVEPARFDAATDLTALLPGVRDNHWRPESRAAPPLPETAQEALRARAADSRTALRAAADLAAARVAPPGAPVPDTARLGDEEREALRDDLLTAARESFRAGVEWYWEPYEDDDDEPTGGSIDDLVAEQQQQESGEAESRQAMRRAFGFAAARGRLLPDPREALQVTLTQARLADPEGWPQLQRDVVATLSLSTS